VPQTPTPEPPDEPEALCFTTEAYADEYLMAETGQDAVPTAYDAINGGGCDFNVAVHAVRIELISGENSWTADVRLPQPARNLRIPFNDLDVPVINADLPDGRYARRVAALAWVRNAEVELDIPGFEDVFLVRDIDSQQAHLFRNRGIWERRGLVNYNYTGAWVCLTCDEFYVATAAVSVRDGVVTSVSSADPNIAVIPVPERFIPIAGLFELLQEAVDRGAHSIDVNYDDEYAYPTFFFINYDDEVEDEERGFTVRSFTPSAPTASTPNSPRAALLRAQARWANSGVADYSYIGAWTCFCPQEYLADTQVAVRGGRVIDVSSADPGFAAVPAPERFVPVEGLFALIRDAITQNAARVEVSYDGTYGYPVELFVDHDERMADEETRFSISSFTLR